MRDTRESSCGNRETSPSGTSETEPTEALVWAFMKMEWRKVPRIFLGLMLALTWSSSAFAQIAIDGRYWEYDGQRVLLLGGWNHGHNPFIDHDTDNDKDSKGVSTVAQIKDAMDELVAAGGNYLRCVLDPGMAAGIQGFDFCAHSGTQYDLNTMTGPFWTRLEMFIAEAKNRNVIVQIEVWDRFDLIDGSWGSWPVSPWNPENNINYTRASSGLSASYGSFGGHPFIQGVPGHPKYENASGLRKQKYDLVRSFQDKFIAKLLSITLGYNNVLYCMNNETHEDPAWGQYWMNFIEGKASAQGKSVSTTDISRRYLSRYCVYIMPMANKDGVVRGRTRFNMLGSDLNRNWDEAADQHYAPENYALESWIKSMISKGQSPHLAIDLHNDESGKLHVSRPNIDLESYLNCMEYLEQLLRNYTWFTEGSTGKGYRNPGTFGEGLLERYSIVACVLELNANWIAGLKQYPSGKNWKLFGRQLCEVFFHYFDSKL